MACASDLFDGVFDNTVTDRREVWKNGRLCRYVRRACVGSTESSWPEVHATWGSYPDYPANAGMPSRAASA